MISTVFTMRCHASVVHAVIVCLSACLSQVGVLVKWLNVGSHKQCHTIAQGLLSILVVHRVGLSETADTCCRSERCSSSIQCLKHGWRP